MKYSIIFFLVLVGQIALAQENNNEVFPQFKSCEDNQVLSNKDCFYENLQKHILSNFKIPESANSYNGKVYALFEVDTIGKFKILYTEAYSEDLKNETKRVFELLEKVKPATYQGRKTYAKYTITIPIPLDSTFVSMANQNKPIEKNKKTEKFAELTEYEDIKLQEYKNSIYKGNNNLPFTHANYAYFDQNLNLVGSNNHTASKPYSYAEIAKYYDFDAEYEKIKKDKKSWWGRKLWNENLVAIQGDGYWFTINPILNLNVGKDFGSDNNYTYVNTRGVSVNGQLGEQLSFSTQIYESQGLFADYYNEYANSIKPSGGNPAIIPGIGIAKQFKDNAYDFPLAEANIKYTPSKFVDLQLGYGRNFIGDGYRSLLQGDGTSPYPFFKINTSFWKIKYTNTYMWLKDVRPEATIDRTYTTKFMANHYLSWNVSKRMNIGFFESVVWGNDNNRGFDVNFVNPIIFYRAVEFSSSSRSGNALLGLTTKYKFNDYTPALYKTTDYGKTWKNISSGIPYGAHTRVVREDQTRKDLLYAGTETGIYVSWNGGLSWESLQLNMPVTPITDLKVHQGDLVVATSGRGFWILDDLGLLNQFKKNNESVELYAPEAALDGVWGSQLSGDNPDFDGTNTFEGVNPANGVVFITNCQSLMIK